MMLVLVEAAPMCGTPTVRGAHVRYQSALH